MSSVHLQSGMVHAKMSIPVKNNTASTAHPIRDKDNKKNNDITNRPTDEEIMEEKAKAHPIRDKDNKKNNDITNRPTDEEIMEANVKAQPIRDKDNKKNNDITNRPTDEQKSAVLIHGPTVHNMTIIE